MKALNPSRIYLPKLADPPATILDHLDGWFPGVGRDIWIERIVGGTVRATTGKVITLATPYMPGLTINYYREVAIEPDVPFEETIIFRNGNILVADKPHFLPVVPAGRYVNQTLLVRLQRSTGLHDLTPIHRLDLETAGLLLFVVRPELRSLYHTLFADGEVRKEYLAIAQVPGNPVDHEWPVDNEWVVENRLAPGEPWFRMKIIEGEPNSSTSIRLLEQRSGRGLFRLTPRTGKKHQLRVHMASLGFPIINDQYYPEAPSPPAWDYTRPLQLLAQRLAFRDPVTGEMLEFVSGRELDF